ncbi:GntR family transcriptional regulator [Pseudogracilibacillus auburnensis]|uniref:GntR family transcriptional regulator n=1 Tax=Pseudogracilibacillus auburnensis TaxID=1494959 RepID=A0A2V3W0Z0_9BACI|nr:GntR family transcriptional regulator [Pseudogracilibacillus auburnensis]PXW87957.1 GntR family transcriptional regulator [Pseudogracilibacillus auburnensis]
MKLTLKKGPLYLQLEEILKERIISGQYPKNTLIPSEPELKEEFGVSIITVRKAVEQLSQQGYVEKRSGIGTTVLDNNAISKLSKGQRFSEYLLEEGHDLSKEFIDLFVVDSKTHHVLESHFHSKCYCIERLYKFNQKPYIHFKHYIPQHISLPSDPEYLQNSLYEIMYQQGVRFHRFKDEFGVGIPDEKIAEKLSIDQRPLLQRFRFSFDLNEKLVEYSEAFYNTEIHRYVVNFDM